MLLRGVLRRDESLLTLGLLAVEKKCRIASDCTCDGPRSSMLAERPQSSYTCLGDRAPDYSYHTLLREFLFQ
jgi:hypothetical protein